MVCMLHADKAKQIMCAPQHTDAGYGQRNKESIHSYVATTRQTTRFIMPYVLQGAQPSMQPKQGVTAHNAARQQSSPSPHAQPPAADGQANAASKITQIKGVSPATHGFKPRRRSSFEQGHQREDADVPLGMFPSTQQSTSQQGSKMTGNTPAPEQQPAHAAADATSLGQTAQHEQQQQLQRLQQQRQAQPLQQQQERSQYDHRQARQLQPQQQQHQRQQQQKVPSMILPDLPL